MSTSERSFLLALVLIAALVPSASCRGSAPVAAAYQGDHLVEAARQGNLRALRRMIAAGININAVNQYGETVLIAATRRHDLPLVSFLVLHGANVNTQSSDYATALMNTAQYGYADVAEFLLRHGANANSMSDTTTVLDEAVTEGHEGVVRVLLKHGASPNQSLPIAMMSVPKHPRIIALLQQAQRNNKRPPNPQ